MRPPKDDPENEIPDFEDDEDSDPLIVWACYCCGNTAAQRPAWGGQCPKCGNVMEEEYL